MPESDWWKKGVFYQIYPRSYKDTIGDGVGDLPGIIKKLDYVEKLGVEGVWISPFFESPMADFGYDVSNYRKVDPLFGSNEDFETLLNKAHDLNLKVIVDMVLSHTSIEHPWFHESRQDKTNPKADWYVWANAKEDGSPPNNWFSIFGGRAWEWDETRQQYYMHNFLKEQPDLNYHNPDVQDAMLGECQYWLDKGVNGFRLDAVNFIFNDKELRDNPPKNDPAKDGYASQLEQPDPYNEQWHVYDKSRPEAVTFIERLRSLTNQYDAIFTLAEIGDDKPIERAAEYTADNKRFHSAYSFSLMTGKEITQEKVYNAVTALLEQPGNGWPSWAFTNHDIVRVVSRWGESIKNKTSFAVMLNKLLLSLRGTPFLYQGDELGLTEADIHFEQLQDPWGKALWPNWKGRDGCRTPMPWQHGKINADFSADGTTPWLPIPEEHLNLSVDLQEKDKNSVLNQTRDFIAWRKTQPLLQTGDIEFKTDASENLIVFDRFDDRNRMMCVFNITEKTAEYDGVEYAPLSATFT